MAPKLRTRRPTGIPPWPLILLEGGEKLGKTWTALEFTGDSRVGRAWALDLAEGTLDEYGKIPGADFEIIIHDGTWPDIMGQLEAAVLESIADKAAGKPPCVLVVDTATAEWAMLRSWVDVRSRRVPANVRALQRDPDAELIKPRHLWNPVDERHKAFLRLLLKFEGPVLVTARGKEISATGPDGQPIQGQKDYRVDAQKDIGFDATAWVRLSRTEPPTIIGVRSVKHGVRPGRDPVVPWPDFTLGALIWDIIGCDPKHSQVREIPELNADQVMPGEEPPPIPDDPEANGTAARKPNGRDWLADIKKAEDACDLEQLGKLWNEAAKLPKGQAPDPSLIRTAGERVRAAALRQQQMAKLFALLVTVESHQRRGQASTAAGSTEPARPSGPLTTYAELSDAEVAEFVTTLTGLKKVGTLAQRLTEYGAVDHRPVVAELLSAHNAEAAIALMEKLALRDDADADVAPLLSEPDREALGVREGQSVGLLDLAEKVVHYCEKHGSGPRVLEAAA